MKNLTQKLITRNIRHFTSKNPLHIPIIANSSIPVNLYGVYDGEWKNGNGYVLESRNPFSKEINGKIKTGTIEDYRNIIRKMFAVKKDWMNMPTPKRGDIVRQIGEQLRIEKDELAHIISQETGKIKTEALGEVQEAIDICDYAVGLSRMQTGSIIPSERNDYTLMERYNPLKNMLVLFQHLIFLVLYFFGIPL